MNARYVPELVNGGFAVEIADAPPLHDALNLADIAHVLMLREQSIVPARPRGVVQLP
jgi:argininosuccinate lyase